METGTPCLSRRNVREFDDRPIAGDDLDAILEAGRRAPSSKNWQPWDFVVVTDRERLREMAGDWTGTRHVAGSAAAVALVAPVPNDQHERHRTHYDLGQASMAMMLAAADRGIGSGHAAVTNAQSAWPRSSASPRAARSPTCSISATRLAVRYNRSPDPTAAPFDDVVHRERWYGRGSTKSDAEPAPQRSDQLLAAARWVTSSCGEEPEPVADLRPAVDLGWHAGREEGPAHRRAPRRGAGRVR